MVEIHSATAEIRRGKKLEMWANVMVLNFQRAVHRTFQTCILNSHLGHTTCRSVADIQSAAAEIRRGKKEERKKETTGQKYNGLPYYIGCP